MTLDEAIKHAEEVAKKQENNAKNYPRPDKSVKGSGKKYNAYLKCAEEHRQLAEWLKELKQLKEQVSNSDKPNKWIPVSERLPEDKTAVLVWCPQYKNIYCAYLEKEQWWIFGAFVQIVPNEVVAWMPLPEPYNASPTGAERSDKE
jgi:hypothetical protein